MAQAANDIAGTPIQKGDNVLEVHIDNKDKLTAAACDESFAMARTFFARYFPEFQYKYMICHSWLLASSLDGLAEQGSNILKFRERFTIVGEEESDEILRYVFRWNTTRRNVRHAVCCSEFAERVKKHAMAGGIFHEATGIVCME